MALSAGGDCGLPNPEHGQIFIRMARIIGGLMEEPIEQVGSGYQPGMHAPCARLQRALALRRCLTMHSGW